MKRSLKCLILALVLVLGSQGLVQAGGQPVNLRINNKRVQATSADVRVDGNLLKSRFSPYVYQDRTFVTIRELTESLGARVGWDQKTKSVSISLGQTNIRLQINSRTVQVNGQNKRVEASSTPRLVDYLGTKESKTVVPLRFVSETLGFDVGWDQASYTAKISSQVQEAPQPSRPKAPGEVRIAIDPGHGGTDSGAVSSVDGTYEKDLTLEVGLKVQKLLEDHGYQVIMTRTGDYYVGLYERADMANDANADFFLSIHFNSAASPTGNGLETFTHHDKDDGDKELAKCIQEELLKVTGMRDRGVKTANFAVVRETDMEAALVELGFLSSEKDMAIIKSPGFTDRVAQAIYRGLVKYEQNYL